MKKEKFSNRLNYAIKYRNIKQIDLAKHLNIDRATINNYLKGKYEPRQDRLYLISNYLNVDPAWLMGYDVPMERSEVTQIKNDKLNAIISSVEKLSEEDLDFVSKFLEKMSNNKK